MIQELKNLKIDKQVKNINLEISDFRIFFNLFKELKGESWVENPLIVDHLLVYLKQIKSAKNFILKLAYLGNVSSSLISVMADDIWKEYTINLNTGLKDYFGKWWTIYFNGFTK